jgi:uncharacterized DUF497 family protein
VEQVQGRRQLRQHGISFELAKAVFEDPFAIGFLDDRQDYGEERFVLLGRAQGSLLYVAYTERMDAVRIISARRATKNERETYLQENF